MITRKFSKKSSLAVLTGAAVVALVAWAGLGLTGYVLADQPDGNGQHHHGGGGGDTTPPDPVTDLAVNPLATTFDSIALDWTATGDDGLTGTATSYDVRYSTGNPAEPPFNGDLETWFGAASQAQGEPAPQAPGSAESFTVTGLLDGTTYYLALKVADEAGNASGPSNVVSETTPQAPPGAWLNETVDDPGRVAFYTALAYDPANNPAIAYTDEGSGRIKFAQWNGSAWAIENVGTGTAGVDLAFDPATGQPVMSFSRSSKLVFARKVDSAWHTRSIENKDALNDVTSLAFDSSGMPCISYLFRGRSGALLKLARFDGSSWSTEVVDDGAIARYNSLVFAPDGNPSIAYSDVTGGGSHFDTLKFAHWNGASWDIEIVETAEVAGVFAALAYDPATGFPAIVHRDDQQNLRFARWNGTFWEIETVDTGRNTNCTLAYLAPATPVISYSNSAAAELRFARWDGFAWQIEVVQRNVSVKYQTSLAIEPVAGMPSISYGDIKSNALKFARKLPEP